MLRLRIERLFFSLGIGLGLIGIVILPLLLWPAHAAPPSSSVQVFTLNTASIAATTTFTPAGTSGRWSQLGVDQPATKAEIWLFLDMGTVNTTTFGLHVSPDGTTWTDHATSSTIGTALIADTNKYITATIEGVYYRIVATTTNSNALTPTIKVVVR